jgi:hypothetical protein
LIELRPAEVSLKLGPPGEARKRRPTSAKIVVTPREYAVFVSRGFWSPLGASSGTATAAATISAEAPRATATRRLIGAILGRGAAIEDRDGGC